MNKLLPARAATATSAFSLLSKSRYAKPLLRPVFLSLAMRNFVILRKERFVLVRVRCTVTIDDRARISMGDDDGNEGTFLLCR